MAKTRAGEVVYIRVGPERICAYCGDPAETVDHTVPAWFVNGNEQLIKRYRLYKVASCNDCNVRAGGKLDKSFRERSRRIAASIRRKSQRLLATADWTATDVADLGPGLLPFIESGMLGRRHLMVRLERLDFGEPPEGMPSLFFEKEAYVPEKGGT